MEDMAVGHPHDVLVLDGTLALGADLHHVWHCDNVGVGSQHLLGDTCVTSVSSLFVGRIF